MSRTFVRDWEAGEESMSDWKGDSRDRQYVLLVLEKTVRYGTIIVYEKKLR